MDMIEMAVRNQNDVHAVDGMTLGICGIPFDPRIDQDNFSSGQPELVGSVTEPCDLNHLLSLTADFNAVVLERDRA